MTNHDKYENAATRLHNKLTGQTMKRSKCLSDLRLALTELEGVANTLTQAGRVVPKEVVKLNDRVITDCINDAIDLVTLIRQGVSELESNINALEKENNDELFLTTGLTIITDITELTSNHVNSSVTLTNRLQSRIKELTSA